MSAVDINLFLMFWASVALIVFSVIGVVAWIVAMIQWNTRTGFWACVVAGTMTLFCLVTSIIVLVEVTS